MKAFVDKMIGNFKIFIVAFACILAICSCNSMREWLEPINIQPQSMISEINDSTFFSLILGMHYSDRKFYLSEISNNGFFILNEDLSLSDFLGGRGRGPGEFTEIGHIEVSQDSIFVVNGNGVSLFVNKQYVRNIPDISIGNFVNTIGAFHLNFAYRDGFIYYYPLGENPEIFKLNIHSSNSNLFAVSNINDKNNKNRGHVVCDGEHIYAVIQNAPFVEKFSMTGEIIQRFDYSEKLDFMYTFRYIDEFERHAGNLASLVRDVSYYDNHLYLLLYLRDFSETLISNVVLVINTKNESDMKLLHLDNGGYFSLAAYSDGLFLFDVRKAELKKYSRDSFMLK